MQTFVLVKHPHLTLTTEKLRREARTDGAEPDDVWHRTLTTSDWIEDKFLGESEAGICFYCGASTTCKITNWSQENICKQCWRAFYEGEHLPDVVDLLGIKARLRYGDKTGHSGPFRAVCGSCHEVRFCILQETVGLPWPTDWICLDCLSSGKRLTEESLD